MPPGKLVINSQALSVAAMMSLRSRFQRIAVLVLVPLTLHTSCRGGRPDLPTATRRGLAYLASVYDGNTFDDDYLRYVYPGEALASPSPSYRVTYRILDAYFIATMLHDAGVDPGPANHLFQRAEALTAALVPIWRRSGIYNLRRHPVSGGIALDTYAILAWLRRDIELARVVQASYDVDGWLPVNLYTGGESFRLQADESWAVRCCIVTSLPKGSVRPMLEDLCGDVRARLAIDTDPVARANLVLHALAAIDEGCDYGIVPPEAPGIVWQCRGEFMDEALRLLEDPQVRRSTLTLANLVEVLASEELSNLEVLSPAVKTILERQEPGGAWRPAQHGRDESGRVFATLRCLLALVRYEQCTGPGLKFSVRDAEVRSTDRVRGGP